MQTTTKYAIAAVFAVLALAGASVSIAEASGPDFNSHPDSLPTAQVVNTTETPNCNGCWDTQVSADYGDKVEVQLFYHNNGDGPAQNTVLRITPKETSQGSIHSFTTKVSAIGASASGVAKVYTPSNANLEFIPGSARWIPNASNGGEAPLPGSENQIFANGLGIGTVQPTSYNGVLIVAYRVYPLDNDNGGNGNCGNDCNPPCDPCCDNDCNPPCDPCCDNDCNPPCDPCCDNDCGGGNGDLDEPDVTTIGTGQSYITEDSAVLFGDLNDLGGYDEAEVWFEWGDAQGFSCYFNNVTGHQTLDGTENFDEPIGGLEPDTTYCYKAFAENASGEAEGSTRYFTTEEDSGNNNGGGGNNNEEDLRIDTQSATSVDENSARLRGEVVDAEGTEVEVWFEWSEDYNEVADDDGSTRTVSGDYEEGDDFDRVLSGLESNTTYYFRACGFDNDTDGDDEDCGGIRSFTTDGGGFTPNEPPVIISQIPPTVVTITASAITNTGANLSGGFNSNHSCDVTKGYFQYGRTTGLGSTSTVVSLSDENGVFIQRLEGLTPGRTYYYRAVAIGCTGTGFGDIRSFTTTGVPVVVPPTSTPTPTPVTPTVTTTTISTGSGLIKLFIDDNRDVVANGEISTYEVNWENVSSYELEDIEIEVTLPNEADFLATTRGRYNEDNHTVFIEIDDLDPEDDNDAHITVRINDRGTENLIVASAVGVFEHPETTARESAIDFDSTDRYNTANNLGASVFGAGFFPGTLLGWLILLLVLFLVFVAARYYALRPAKRPVYYQAPPAGYQPYQPAPRG